MVTLKATRRQSKAHNSGLVLRTIYQAGSISRADIARATTLARPTVSSIVSDLIESKLVTETGVAPSAGGKPPTLLEVDKEARRIVCLDIASREFRGALVNLRGELIERASLPLQEAVGDAALSLAHRLIDDLIGRSPVPLLGIGIGTPGLIDPLRGVVRRSINLGWEDLPLRRILEDRYQLPIYLMNDSQAAALAEYAFGGSRRSPHLLLIKIGRGIGAGIVINGELFHGDGFGAGEIGQVMVQEAEPPVSLESVASSRALLERGRRAAGSDLTWEQFVNGVRAGDARLEPLVISAGAQLGVAIAHLVAALNIHQIVISGRVTQLGKSYLDSARHSAERHLLPALLEHTQISESTLGEDIVLLGCTSSILKHELRIV